jgi:hypothetical protein
MSLSINDLKVTQGQNSRMTNMSVRGDQLRFRVKL